MEISRNEFTLNLFFYYYYRYFQYAACCTSQYTITFNISENKSKSNNDLEKTRILPVNNGVTILRIKNHNYFR